MSQGGSDLYMLHMRHVRNDKYQDSYIELHPDRALNNLNGVVKKNAQSKFVLTMTGYKYCINHVDNNQYVLMEIIKGIRYYGWRMLSSHALSYNNNSMEMIVETNFFFEIDSLEFLVHNQSAHETGSDRYALYEAKKSEQLLAEVEAMRRAEQQALSIDFDYEEVMGTNPAARLRKMPQVAEYGQVLLDSSRAVAQAGPYGFARQHGHSPKNRRSSDGVVTSPATTASPSVGSAATSSVRRMSDLPPHPHTSSAEVRTNGAHTEASKAAVPVSTQTSFALPTTAPAAAAVAEVVASHQTVHQTIASPVAAAIASPVTAPVVAAAQPGVAAASSTTGRIPSPALSTAAEPGRRPSLTSGLTLEEKQSAADKLFQKYGMRKGSFTGSARNSFTSASGDAPKVSASSDAAAPPASAAAPSAASLAPTAEPAVAPAKTSVEVTNAANRLFEKYSRNPESQSANTSSASITVPSPATVPVPASTAAIPAPVVPAPVVPAPSPPAVAAAPAVTPSSNIARLSNIFTQPEAEPVTVKKSELVHHPNVVMTPDGQAVRSLGGFRRVKSVVASTDDHEDYGDLTKLKNIEHDDDSVSPMPPIKFGGAAASSVSSMPPPVVERKPSGSFQVPSAKADQTALPSETVVTANKSPRTSGTQQTLPDVSALRKVGSREAVEEGVSQSKSKLPVPAASSAASSAPSVAPPSVPVAAPAAAPVPAPSAAPVVSVAPVYVTPVKQVAPVPAMQPLPSALSTSSDGPRPASARNSVSFHSSVPVPAPDSAPSTPIAASAAVPVAIAVEADEDEEPGLRRASSSFKFDPRAKQPVAADNATLEERMALKSHENSKTNHYSKLGSAFVNENTLGRGGGAGGRGGRGRGLGVR